MGSFVRKSAIALVDAICGFCRRVRRKALRETRCISRHSVTGSLRETVDVGADRDTEVGCEYPGYRRPFIVFLPSSIYAVSCVDTEDTEDVSSPPVLPKTLADTDVLFFRGNGSNILPGSSVRSRL